MRIRNDNDLARRAALVGLLSVVMGTGNSAEAYLFTDFGLSAYNANTAAMDIALGISGYTIEDFEDATLDPDLTLTGFTPGDSFQQSQLNAGEAWDGNHVLSFYAVNDASPGAFNFNVAGGATSVGFALSSWHHPNLDLQNPKRPNRLRINGGPWIDIDNVNFPNLNIVGNGRSGYLRIDQGPGDAPITIVEISDPGDESLRIDHVAFATVSQLYTIIDFAPSAYDVDPATTDATLGTTGYTIEDLEDGTLHPELTLTGFGALTFPAAGPSDAWDGSNVAEFSGVTEENPGALNFINGAASVGIGLSGFNTATNSLRINGGPWTTIDTTNFPNLALGDGRSGYLRIDRPEGAPPITLIEIAAPDDEALRIDHLAFDSLALPRVYTITDFAPSAYEADTASMNATLGIAGYTVEDFEDAALVSGLALSRFGSLSFPDAVGSEAWDGGNVASFSGVTVSRPGALTFVDGTASVGIALSSFHNHTNRLRINRGPWIEINTTNFPNLAIVGDGRSGYLRIDRPQGADPIRIVEFADPDDETLRIDHVAFDSLASPRVYTITDFGADAYDPDTATMDAALGITDYEIEDFEDGTLHPDFSLTNFGVFNFPEGAGTEAWDGGNIFSFYDVTPLDPGALNFAVGANSVGIGLSSWHYPNLDPQDPQRPNLIRINGGPWITINNTNFPNLNIVGNGRAGYLRIDRPAGAAPITVVEFADPGDETLKIDHVAFTEFIPDDPLLLTDVSRDPVAGELSISWESKEGRLYNLRSETGLSTDPTTWPIFDGNADLAATPPENTLVLSLPADPERFFVIEGFSAPPASVFAENFDAAAALPAGWTAGANPPDTGTTVWGVGSPSGAGPEAANSAPNCAATNIAGDYGTETAIYLRSPAIDLTNASGATLNYAQFVDIEEGFDLGSLAILDAADDSELRVLQAVVDGSGGDWMEVRKALPAAALGKSVKLEFRFAADDIQNFAGWYLDDVVVTVP